MNATTLEPNRKEGTTKLLSSGTLTATRLLPPHFEEGVCSRCDCSPEKISARAATVTLVLKGILDQGGFPHGGISE
jgi:hypothetical protein